ncbi:MAG: hypothetical protein JSR91_09430 [Proteobacteria bacterium]|nr:hypothetical protein [Pseudomonadota bacterium]
MKAATRSGARRRSFRRAAAARFAVSESAAIKLVHRWKQTGRLEAGRMGGHRLFSLAAHELLVRELIAADPATRQQGFGA